MNMLHDMEDAEDGFAAMKAATNRHHHTPTVSPRTVHFTSERDTSSTAAAAASAHSYPKTASRRSTSAAIPINRESVLRRTNSETQLQEHEAEADYKDYLFYSRIVNGILSQRGEGSSDNSRSTRECLESIVRARHDHQHGYSPEYLRRHSEEPLMVAVPSHGYYYATKQDAHHYMPCALQPHVPLEEESEEGVFDLEL
jgi:hypothetical protein